MLWILLMFNVPCINAFSPLTFQPNLLHIVKVEESNHRNQNIKEPRKELHNFLDQGLVPDQGVVLQESPDEEPQGDSDHCLAENKDVVDPCHLEGVASVQN